MVTSCDTPFLNYASSSRQSLSCGWLTKTILMKMKALRDFSGETDEETTKASGCKD